MTSPDFSRRRFLRGLGTTLALPFLESVMPMPRLFAQEAGPASAAGGSAGPERLLYVYLPNGVHPPSWIPAASSAEAPPVIGRHGTLPPALPSSLQALEPWRDSLSILTGLTCNTARANGDGPGDHARAGGAFLTGVQPLKADGAVSLGTSADQLAAQAIGGRTRLRSLQLGCEAAGKAGQCDSGYACAYSDNISWQDATTPTSKDVHPQRLFDRLFRGDAADAVGRATRLRRRNSVLDAVREDAKSLGQQLNRKDLDKLEEYFQGLRELERRLEFASASVDLSVPDERRPQGIPDSFREHSRLLMDMLVLTFQTDITRIATFMFGNEGSNRRYLDVDIRGGHHGITHHKGDKNMIAEVCKINALHMEELAYLLGRLASVAEGEHTLLHNTAIVCGSAITDGNRHDHHALPMMVAGGQALGLSHGKLREYPVETPLGNLHLELLHRFGVPATSLGDASGRLAGLEA